MSTGLWSVVLQLSDLVCTLGDVPLRQPTFLDMATLVALAEYNDVPVPHAAEIVEKTVSKRGGSAALGMGPASIGANAGRDIEFQASYSLSPNDKATVSRVIDGLHRAGVVASDAGATPLARGELLEPEGDVQITGCSIAAKLLYLALQVVRDTDGDLSDLDAEAMGPQFPSLAKDIFIGNQALPIPMLMELTGTNLEPRVFLNLSPDHFVDAAAIDRVEGHVQVLGSVSQMVASGGFLTAERWLLHGWELLLRRTLMTTIDNTVKELVEVFDVDLPEAGVQAYFTGPAIVLDVVAVY